MATCIEVITSPNCPHSNRALRIAQKVAAEMDGILLYEVNTITEAGAQYAENLSIESTPAIIINGKLAYVGLPKKSDISKMIAEERKLQRERDSYFF